MRLGRSGQDAHAPAVLVDRAEERQGVASVVEVVEVVEGVEVGATTAAISSITMLITRARPGTSGWSADGCCQRRRQLGVEWAFEARRPCVDRPGGG